MNFNKKQLLNFDYILFGAVIALVIFGIIAIGSATRINVPGESKDLFNKQILWFIIGLILMFLVSIVDYNYFSRYYIAFYVIGILMLLAVFAIGSNYNGAYRWIEIGPLTLQPSEFTKINMVFCIAKFIDKEQLRINNIFVLGVLLFATAIPVLLIRRQPSLSSSLVIIVILVVELFIAKLSYKYIFPVFGITISVGLLIIFDATRENSVFIGKILENYQIDRIRAVLHPEAYRDLAYQTLKSMQALGSGQLSGKGLYQGTLNQLSYLPEAYNDFIFSVIGEEFGFIGCSAVMFVLLFIIVKCLLIAKNAADFLGKLIAAGVAGMYAFQTFVNIGVATGLVPPTGMGLPFISYGGSSLWTNMIALGLVLNIGMKKPKSLFEGG